MANWLKNLPRPREIIGAAKYHLKWRKEYDRSIGKSADREVYHGEILPWLAGESSIRDVLDIGCEWYNLHHRRIFRGHRYWTIDVDPGKEGFGGRNHVTGSALRLDQYFRPSSFDLILCNGVFGWGVNGQRDVTLLAEQMAGVLRPDGKVVVGWNPGTENAPELNPLVAMADDFRSWAFPPKDDSQFLANPENNHTFAFFEKPAL